ncbi:MAG: Ig-like domain-containing protein, partial [Oscillospiraceae bacterium]|nr:Ig-like domain-containing protein [Oscillospiraceae bacterium]
GAGSVLWDDEEKGFVYPEKPEEASPTRRTQFGEDFSTLLWSSEADPAQIESAPCGFIAYQCTACWHVESEPKDQCPECKAKGTPGKPIMVLFYQDNYTLTLRFPDGSPVVAGLFRLSTPEQALALLGSQLDGIAAVEDIQLSCRNARIEAGINRTTREIKSLYFKRDVDAAVKLRFDPAFSPAGEASLRFTMGESTNFSFVWPAAYLSAHERTMKTRENSQLTVRYDSPWDQETPEKTECVWSSSDEEICAVDQEGYLKTGKETGTAVITIAFELDGKTYEDQCVINVKVPVEKVEVSRRHLKLDAGETKRLTAKVSPRKATYPDVTWHSENPEIATVDDNGLVTAVAPGDVVLYARTVDGYYISKCFVTVKGGAG